MLVEPVLCQKKNTNELRIRPKMAPNCLFFPASHWFSARTGQLRSACDPQKKKTAYRWIDFFFAEHRLLKEKTRALALQVPTAGVADDPAGRGQEGRCPGPDLAGLPAFEALKVQTSNPLAVRVF